MKTSRAKVEVDCECGRKYWVRIPFVDVFWKCKCGCYHRQYTTNNSGPSEQISVDDVVLGIIEDVMIKGAFFSEDGKYRYHLFRIWEEHGKIACCIGLNPSTASGEDDDPTITRLIGTLKALGYGGLRMCNLFGFISSKPEALNTCPDPIKENDKYLAAAVLTSNEVIFCWGGFRQAKYRVRKMIELFPDALCFGKNADGSPWHPLAMMYIKGFTYDKATLQKFR